MSNLPEVDSICKSFGDKQVLTDIDLKCQPGDIIGLLDEPFNGISPLHIELIKTKQEMINWGYVPDKQF
jgi:ABC-type uncharacterized transport system ATPase subunit